MKLPISAYTEKYFKERGIAFSDFEKACIIFQHRDSLDEALAVLKELAETTSDGALKAQISDRIAYTENSLAKFKENSGGKYLYLTWEYEDFSGDNYFREFKNVLDFGIKYSEMERFKIERVKLDCPYGESTESGNCFYDKSGRLISLELSVPSAGEPKDTHGASVRFEDMFIPFEFPFERGDIVRCPKDDIIGIIPASRDDRAEHNEKVAASGAKACSSDYTVNIEYIDKNGGVQYAECDMLLLEKVTEQGELGKPEWDMLCCMSEFMKGKRSFFDLQYFIKEFIDD